MTEIEKQLLIENNEMRFRLAENKLLIEALEKSEKKEYPPDPYTIIIHEMKDGACIISKDNTIMLYNQLFADIFSWKNKQFIGLDFSSLINKPEKNILEFLQLAREKRNIGKMITIVDSPDIVRHYFLTANLLSNTSDNDLCIIFTDVTHIKQNRVTNETLLNNARLAALNITERKKSEKELIKVNRLFTVISLINQMIIRNQVRETIFTEACNIVIEHGKFRMAWIGLLDENGDSVIPVTWAGAELGYLTTIKKISTQKHPEGNGPTGTAIRNREIYYCNDIASDPNMNIWKDLALERDYRASIAIPIIVFNKVIGAFTIYVSEANFFNQAEIDLLQQVTSDISFALEVTETEKKRIVAEKEITKINTELEQRVAIRTQQLEYTNKELEAFTYSVSHDLRAPLRNINGWGQVLHEEFKNQLGADGLKYLDRVLSETLRMNNLIDDLLKLSRVTMAERKRERVDLTSIANNIAHRLKDKPINYKLEIIIQPDLVTFGDARMLDIALTNLLENSYKFTGKLPFARIEFGMTLNEGKPIYWVKDNGVGFDMDNSKNLFGVFQRMHNQNEFPGTGVGLATVQRIIHRHNGVIWADSMINEGTTFFFTIPDVNL